MRLLEQVVIDTAGAWGIEANAESGATGVWVRRNGLPDAKLCAMGVRIRKNTTMHGLAINVDPDLSHFDLIVPCGLAGRPVTSLKQLLGDDAPSMVDVKDRLCQVLTRSLRQNIKPDCCSSGSAPGTSVDSPPTPGRPTQ